MAGDSAGVRRRKKSLFRYEPGPEYDPELPYGGLVYVARQKKPDSYLCVAVQVTLVISALALCYIAYVYSNEMQFYVTRAYAHLGHAHAQHAVGQRYLHGKGVKKNGTEAMQWFKKAADQGHPHASYNFAVGKLKGMHRDAGPGEVHKLIKHAAANGVEEAHEVLHHACSKGLCD
ncbi:unnamed protein product [Darwinula stevensoni]|uniref:Uncharacterized protein n=1 Tax=Darwinula stevensoni TaxID=69355 RepID=A0A7R8XB04_9CRUS|nr:unnamed protein product [Darwinula stevensoni]CAG0891874.1 unnamed protein product [Darwinula stevensoni]